MVYERTITSNGRKYRQLVESVWDSERKRSRVHVIRHLGRVIEKDGRETVISAQSRFDSIDMAYPVGDIAVFWKISEEFSVMKNISDSIGDDHATAILVLVLNQLTGRRPLTKIGEWIYHSPLHRWLDIDPGKMTKDYFLSALDSITSDAGEERMTRASMIQHGIADAWRNIVGDDDARYFFYQDITRIRWNGNENEIAERGYGAQVGRPHIGFGLLVSRDHYFPISAYTVRGSKLDKVTVPESVDNLARWYMKNIVLVWDRGFDSRSNIDYALSKGFHVISGGNHTSGEVMEWVSRYDDSEIEKRENVFQLSSSKGIYFTEEVGYLYGHECRIVVIMDPDRRNRTRVERDIAIQSLQEGTSGKRRSDIMSGLGSIVRPSRGRRGYVIDHEEEARARRLDGRSLIFSTDPTIKGREIINTYLQKDRVEKAFRHLKGDACLSPVRYQLPGRVDAYLSVVSFIAYELIAGIKWKLDANNIGITYEELMDKLSEIHEVALLSRGSRIFRWTAIPKETEKIVKPFGILQLRT